MFIIKINTGIYPTIGLSLKRLFYDRKVVKNVERLVDDTHPDVALILHYLKKISPAVLVGLKNRNIPIIVRLSDFYMVCPQAHFIRGGKACTLCCKGNSLYSVFYKCVKNNYMLSAINYLATAFHRFRGYFDLIDRFIITNQFSYDLFLSAGFPKKSWYTFPHLSIFWIFLQPRKNRDWITLCIWAGWRKSKAFIS